MIEGIGRMPQISPAMPDAGPRGGDHRSNAQSERIGGGSAPTTTPPQRAAEMAASPPVDMARVASLREAIDNGSYKIDAAAIAGAILAQGGL